MTRYQKLLPLQPHEKTKTYFDHGLATCPHQNYPPPDLTSEFSCRKPDIVVFYVTVLQPKFVLGPMIEYVTLGGCSLVTYDKPYGYYYGCDSCL